MDFPANAVSGDSLEANRLHDADEAEVFGRVASDLTHELRNLLTVVLSFGTLVRDALPAPDQRRDDLDHLLGATEQAADLARLLAALRQPRYGVAGPVQLADAVNRVATLLRKVTGRRVQLTIDTDANAPAADVDEAALVRALVATMSYARDTLQGGGRVTLRVTGSTHPAHSDTTELQVAITPTDTAPPHRVLIGIERRVSGPIRAASTDLLKRLITASGGVSHVTTTDTGTTVIVARFRPAKPAAPALRSGILIAANSR